MVIQYKAITADAQLVSGECHLVAVELTHTGADTSLIIYDEPSSTKSAARKVATLRVSEEQLDAFRVWPMPGIKCNGIYTDYAAGQGTIYYYV